jgi:hypothetical protein
MMNIAKLSPHFVLAGLFLATGIKLKKDNIFSKQSSTYNSLHDRRCPMDVYEPSLY